MATYSIIVNDSARYPDGTTVNAYPVSNWGTPAQQFDPSGAVPVGSSSGSAAMSNGTATISGLNAGDYWLYALVGSQRRYQLAHAGPETQADLLAGTALQASNNLSDVASAATARSNLGAQASDATLTALAGLATGADQIPYSTGTDVFSQLQRDTDGTLAANSDTRIATQKACKTYSDGRLTVIMNTYREIFSGWGRADAASGATYVLSPASPNMVLASAATAGAAVFYLDPALLAISGTTTKYNMIVTLLTNATASTVNFTTGLYPVSAVAGAAATVSITTGTVQAGSTVAMNAPAASTRFQGVSSDFTAPAAGYFAIGVVISGAMAASSSVQINAQLAARNV